MAVALMFGAAIFLLIGEPPAPVAKIKVVDLTGRPIAGATIKPDGLRPKGGGGHYSWTEENEIKPNSTTTDADGIARVPYPRIVCEHIETGEISFEVHHPEFCSDRPFRTVSPTPPANARISRKLQFWWNAGKLLVKGKSLSPDPVILQFGGAVRLSGIIGPEGTPLKKLHAQVSGIWPGQNELFATLPDNSLFSHRIPTGQNYLRLIHFPENGRICFSDAVTFNSVARQTNVFHLTLRPGLRLKGKVDDSVPRPVKQGYAITRVFTGDNSGGRDVLMWFAWSPIQDDGSFTFESLPSGRVEIIATCEGYVSKSNDGTNSTRGHVIPQLFRLEAEDLDITLQMEEGASCELHITDDQNRPLAGAEAGFWPNVIWDNTGTTIFASDLLDSVFILTNQAILDWREMKRNPLATYAAMSDSNGVAIVRNLPAFHQPFYVGHTNYEMRITQDASGDSQRIQSVNLTPGQTTKAWVTLQRKGTQFIEHPR